MRLTQIVISVICTLIVFMVACSKSKEDVASVAYQAMQERFGVQQLQLTETEINSLVVFLQTLSGTNVYTDTKWSNPFLN
jgi:hypothetical protein